MLGSLKFAVLQFADFHFPQNPRIARTPCTYKSSLGEFLCFGGTVRFDGFHGSGKGSFLKYSVEISFEIRID